MQVDARRAVDGPLASHGPSAPRRKYRKGAVGSSETAVSSSVAAAHGRGGADSRGVGRGGEGEVSYERSVRISRPMAEGSFGGGSDGSAGRSPDAVAGRAAAQARRDAMAARAESEQASALLSQQVEALTRILPAAPHNDRGKLLRGVLENPMISPHDLEQLTNSIMQLRVPYEKLELAGVFLDQKAYFSALRCVYTDPELLTIMLNSIKMAISASNDSSERAAAAGKDAAQFWRWGQGDRRLFCMQV